MALSLRGVGVACSFLARAAAVGGCCSSRHRPIRARGQVNNPRLAPNLAGLSWECLEVSVVRGGTVAGFGVPEILRHQRCDDGVSTEMHGMLADRFVAARPQEPVESQLLRRNDSQR